MGQRAWTGGEQWDTGAVMGEWGKWGGEGSTEGK